MKVVSIRLIVFAIVGILILPLACGGGQGTGEQYIKVESFKLDYGTASRDSISLYLLNEKQSRTSDSMTFILNVDDRSYHDIPNLHASVNFFGNQLFATPPQHIPMFTEKIININISSSDTVLTELKTFLPHSELAELFYVQQANDYGYYKIEDFTPKEGGFHTSDRELTTYLIFRDSVQPIINQQFTFKILMSDSAEFTVTSPFINIE
jgi:hypothetical protein